ncbi:12542_t:CDS:2 [Entrophospora sp. SA101]|nr:12542_t:CDS:2 [Entrophospora sp. SA101]CAJ0911441.1 584_t:CDS:2 [Entrophospora sp. SA101]
MSTTTTLTDSLTELSLNLNQSIQCIHQVTIEQEEKNTIQQNIHKFLQSAKNLEISLTKVIYEERQTPEIALKQEIESLSQTLSIQKEVITKYTDLMRKWKREFEIIEEENDGSSS